jgi:hypothetical protein
MILAVADQEAADLAAAVAEETVTNFLNQNQN